jgi:uncharacterized FlgJ-related protein
MKRIDLRLTDEFFEKIYEAAKTENFIMNVKGISAFIKHVLVEYLNKHPTKTTAPKWEELTELKAQQNTFFKTLEKMLAQQAKQADYLPEFKFTQVLKNLENNRLSLKEIHQRTNIKEEELLIALGHLYSEGKIGFDERWRYYIL